MKVVISKTCNALNELGYIEPVHDPRPTTNEEGFMTAEQEAELEALAASIVSSEIAQRKMADEAAAEGHSPEEYLEYLRNHYGDESFVIQYKDLLSDEDELRAENKISISHAQLKSIILEELEETKLLRSLYGTHVDLGKVKVPHRGSKSAPTIPVYDEDGKEHYVSYDSITYDDGKKEGLSNQIKQRRLERQKLEEEGTTIAGIEALASRMRSDIESVAKEAKITTAALLSLISQELTQK